MCKGSANSDQTYANREQPFLGLESSSKMNQEAKNKTLNIVVAFHLFERFPCAVESSQYYEVLFFLFSYHLAKKKQMENQPVFHRMHSLMDGKSQLPFTETW